jgi:hypothetical protein
MMEFVEQYGRNWKEHIDMISSRRIPEKGLRMSPRRQKGLGRPLKQWKDS